MHTHDMVKVDTNALEILEMHVWKCEIPKGFF